MPDNNIAIIGGTGFEQLPPEIFAEPLLVETPFGAVRVLSVANNYAEPNKLYFLARHGATHGLAPHQIPFHANTAALIELGVKSVFATNAVGGVRSDLKAGDLVVIDDFIDFTRNRPLTYYSDTNWRHTDFTTPYSPRLRRALLDAANTLGMRVADGGVYLCCDGPRFESPAEIRMFARWGADVVGMTGLPEATFAGEVGIEYAALAIVTNPGAGLTPNPVDHNDVTATMQQVLPAVRELLLNAVATIAAV